MNINDLWRSTDPIAWEQSLQRYWNFVQPGNLELERALDKLDIKRIESLSPEGWYSFLHDEYFRWKYTAPNRYATTTSHLRKYIDAGDLGELESVRKQILNLDRNNVRLALTTATRIRGLGVAGASGILSLLYPDHFATVDQFVVKALRSVSDLPDANVFLKMNKENLSVTNGVLLTAVLKQKAKENNMRFGTDVWTPRKIDMVLWTFGR